MSLFNFFKSKTYSKTPEISHGNIEDIIIDDTQKEFIEDIFSNAESLVNSYNEKYNGALDYTEKSLEALDELLDNITDFEDQMDDEMTEKLIVEAGSYIFEVARKTYGGKYFWYDPLDEPLLVTGIPDFEISLLAFNKVRQRLENGYNDNIPYFFKGYSERVKKGTFGDKAMIV